MIAAVVALLVAAPSLSPAADDPDLRCLAAVSAVLGTMSDSNAPDDEAIAGLTGIFMYYLGRVDARHPGFDYAGTLGSLMNAPGYEKRLALDLKRCGGEAEARGRMLKDLGEELKTSVPLTTAKPG